jgi:hypothetical protein
MKTVTKEEFEKLLNIRLDALQWARVSQYLQACEHVDDESVETRWADISGSITTEGDIMWFRLDLMEGGRPYVANFRSSIEELDCFPYLYSEILGRMTHKLIQATEGNKNTS